MSKLNFMRPRGVRPKFIREGNQDFIEIEIIGDTNVYRGKVREEHIQRFPEEWEAYKTGKPVSVVGRPLTDVPGITSQIAEKYTQQGIRTLEELANTSDAAIRNLGVIGAINARKEARKLAGGFEESMVGT